MKYLCVTIVFLVLTGCGVDDAYLAGDLALLGMSIGSATVGSDDGGGILVARVDVEITNDSILDLRITYDEFGGNDSFMLAPLEVRVITVPARSYMFAEHYDSDQWLLWNNYGVSDDNYQYWDIK